MRHLTEPVFHSMRARSRRRPPAAAGPRPRRWPSTSVASGRAGRRARQPRRAEQTSRRPAASVLSSAARAQAAAAASCPPRRSARAGRVDELATTAASGSIHGGRAVPGAPVGVVIWVRHGARAACARRRSALGGGAVHRGADERMPQLDGAVVTVTRPDRSISASASRPRRSRPRPASTAASASRVVGGDHQQQGCAPSRQAPRPVEEHPLDRLGDREPGRQRLARPASCAA